MLRRNRLLRKPERALNLSVLEVFEAGNYVSGN
jgi:hypothetical protein